MPAVIQKAQGVRLGPIVRRVATPDYEQRTSKLLSDWQRSLRQSSFLTLKSGLINAKAALDRISNIEQDWDSYGAEAPTGDAIQAAKQILDELAAALVLPSTIVPSAEGGVSIYFMTGERTAYIEIYNQGSQALVMYDRSGNGEVFEIGLDIPLSGVGGKILAYLG